MTEPPSRAESMRENYRRQLIDGIGGWTGALITAIPTTVFVIVNVTAGLRPAVIAAVASALVLTAYRFLRKQSVQQALSGLLGVAVGAFIAARTGQARGYFLLGIWTSFAYAVPFAVSLVVRRPLVGVLWEFLDPTPDRRGDDAPRWHRRRPLLVAYSWATLAATVVFLARGIVQLALYGENSTGWLAFARIAMGYPLFVLAAGVSFLVIRRARHRLQPAAD
ncbi:DUF3159 domain-containing protein [uncultured Jatrophihabitans sp.]|uniref:DUF3159 domain-containing protein n=1 Tax=uncultured Jatrophihabitans sp. TaxID=1610747 RepID=UPI0035CADA32